MKQFINQEMLAPNVITVDLDMAIVREFLDLHRGILDQPGFATVRPTWNSDLKWISANRTATFDIFQSAFDRLDIAQHVQPYLGIDSVVRLYAGFLVVRSFCTEPNFHVDWRGSNNQAFTLITPVSDNAESFGLLYTKLNGEIGEYEYRLGEAIIFGDHFSHSTKPGNSPDPVVLLCFQFGTDRMADWEQIVAVAGKQSHFIRQPDGAFVTLRNGPATGRGAA